MLKLVVYGGGLDKSDITYDIICSNIMYYL